VTTTAAYPGHPERIEIIGSKGHAALVGGRLQLSFLDGRSEVVEAEGNTGSGANIMDFPHDAHRAVIADFLDAIEAGRDPVVTGEEALTSQRWIDRDPGSWALTTPSFRDGAPAPGPEPMNTTTFMEVRQSQRACDKPGVHGFRLRPAACPGMTAASCHAILYAMRTPPQWRPATRKGASTSRINWTPALPMSRW
jgi:hypothetical protein